MLKVIQYDGNLKEIAKKLNNRKEEISIEVNNAVSDIIEDIRKNGNQALINYCQKFDGYQIKDESDFVVSNQEKEEALKQVDQDCIRILERTKKQITEFHKNQIDKSWSLYKDNGVIMGQMVPGHFLLPPLRGIPGPCEPEQRSAAGRGQQDGPLPGACLLYTSRCV